jgi:hypothetical protein
MAAMKWSQICGRIELCMMEMILFEMNFWNYSYDQKLKYETITLLFCSWVNGCKISAYVRRSGPLSREGSLFCHICCDTGNRIPRFNRGTVPFSHLLGLAKGCWGPILTRNQTGLHSVASYDTREEAEDLF